MKEFGARFWRSLVRRARTFRRDAGRSSSSLEKFQWRALWQLVKRYTCYSVLAVAIGAVVGVVTAVFGHGLLWLNEFRAEHLFWFVPFLGVAGLVIMSVNMHWGGRAQRGMGLVFDVGLGKEGSIPLRLVPLTIFSTWMTHLFGGSAGREGVAVQIGATLSMQFARIAPASLERHIILASGMAAGFAGLFGTPIAATFFALEVMVVGSIYYDALAPALIAAYTASYTARALGLHAMAMPIGPVPDMSGRFMLLTILAGLVFGIVGWGFSCACISHCSSTIHDCVSSSSAACSRSFFCSPGMVATPVSATVFSRGRSLAATFTGTTGSPNSRSQRSRWPAVFRAGN